MDKIEIICLQSEAFYNLLDTVIEQVKRAQPAVRDKWISGPEAMQMLRIKSKTTLQKLRDEGRIRFSQADKKNILYDSQSIYDYLEDFVYEPFDAPLNKKRKP